MTQQPDDKKLKRLLSVEFQTEVDVPSGRPERRMFLKMYFDARDSGLLADIGDRRWRTLCALATYMNEDGTCYPSQARIAKDLGIYRQRVNERIHELLAYRFQGRPVITVKKARLTTPYGGRWASNVYQIHPVTGFHIFSDEGRSRSTASKTQTDNPRQNPYVRIVGHWPVSGNPDTGNPDTNKSHVFNKNVNVFKNTEEGNDDEARGADLRARALALDIVDVCKDKHSMGSYLQIARTYPEELIREALSLTKDQAARGRIRKSRGAYFTDAIARLAKDHHLPPKSATGSR